MTPKDDTRDEELLARFRQAGADAPGPSDAVRAAILAESRRVAEELAKQAPRPPIEVSRPAANDSRWKITAFGTVGAALLAALIFAPRYWENTRHAQLKSAPVAALAPPSAPSPAAQDQANAEAPKLEELKPNAALSYTAPARQSPSEPNSLQEIVVTQADRKSAKTSGVASPRLAASASAPVPAPTARANPLDLSAYSVVGGVPRAQRAESAGAADSARAGSALTRATLHSAAAQGDVTQAATMLDQGAVIDARDEAGRTPLMLAVTQGRLETVRLLLARGADPNAADNSGHTPLQQATKRNLQDIAALLEQAGAH